VEHQIGHHLLEALRHESTIAVLTTVIQGEDGVQHAVSFGLNSAQFEKIRGALGMAAPSGDERAPCVGFHCLVNSEAGEPKA